jgi:hypothetical protein
MSTDHEQGNFTNFDDGLEDEVSYQYQRHTHLYEIVEAIISQAYPLMVNRFNRFLV